MTKVKYYKNDAKVDLTVGVAFINRVNELVEFIGQNGPEDLRNPEKVKEYFAMDPAVLKEKHPEAYHMFTITMLLHDFHKKAEETGMVEEMSIEEYMSKTKSEIISDN